MNENIKIKIVRLQSGIDIISEIEEYTQEQIVRLVNPMILMFKRTQIGSVMMLSPWLPVELIEENITNISNCDILTVFDPKDKLVDYYKEMVNIHLVEWLKNVEDVLNNSSFDDEETDEETDDISFEEDSEELENIKKNNLLH